MAKYASLAPTKYVDRECDDADVENEGADAVEHRGFPHHFGCDLDIRSLESHPQARGEVGEIPVVWLACIWKVDSACVVPGFVPV